MKRYKEPPVRTCVNLYVLSFDYSKMLNNRTRGANNEHRVGFCGSGIGSCGPGGGLVVINVVASHYVY